MVVKRSWLHASLFSGARAPIGVRSTKRVVGGVVGSCQQRLL